MTGAVRPSQRATGGVILAGLLMAAAVVYFPGLRSGLYVDDYYNLAGLGRIDNGGWLQFLFGGIAGPTGRPLSLLTFALQHGSWPHDIAAFKAVNIAIHLANGVLVFFLCRALARARSWPEAQAHWFCAATTSLWLLHPMQVSTVLYVVQRMTQLSALCVLAGALAWVQGRRRCATGRPGGWAWMIGAVVAGTGAAVLCKENGVLLPLLLLVLDRTMLRDLPAPPAYRYWRAAFLVLPLAAVIAYLGRQAVRGPQLFAGEPYTLYQKTLTEAMALAAYLYHLVLPRPSAFGLFHDDFPVARGLLDPPLAAVAVAAVVVLAAGGVALRRRMPLAAAGVLWFFTGHLLESTVLNLEIYFEHRNYLPSLGIALLFAAAVQHVRRITQRDGLALAALLVPLVLAASITLQNTVLWSQPLRMAEESVRVHPQSRWAVANLGNRYLAVGRLDDAEALYRDAAALFPDALYPVLRQSALAACVRNAPIADAAWNEMIRRARRGRGGGFFVWPELDLVLRVMQQGECPGLDPVRLQRLLDTLGSNADYGVERGLAWQLATNLCLLRGDLVCALERSRAALAVYTTPDRQVQYSDILLALGRGADAAAAIDDLRALLAKRPLQGLAYRAQLAELEARLAALPRR
jgi:tetratricopeptide (TPR) repeat protein